MTQKCAKGAQIAEFEAITGQHVSPVCWKETGR